MFRGRRAAKAVLVLGTALIGFLGQSSAVFLVCEATDREDSFVLRNVELNDFNHLRKLEGLSERELGGPPEQLPVAAHRLKRGSGTVFAWRFYSNGKLSVIDDEDYRKITIWIPGSPPTSPSTLALGDESKVILISSIGGSAWPRSECCGYGTSGTITITPSWRGLAITVDAQITPVGSKSRQCTLNRVNRTFTAREIAFDDLTPWLGKAGRHPYDETYRR